MLYHSTLGSRGRDVVRDVCQLVRLRSGYKRARIQGCRGQRFRGLGLMLRACSYCLTFQVQGLGSRVWGLGFGVWGVRFRVWGLGFGVWGSGSGVSGLEFEVLGLELRSLGSGMVYTRMPTNADPCRPMETLRGWGVETWGEYPGSFFFQNWSKPCLCFRLQHLGFRCRTNMAHTRQSRPYSGLSFEVKVGDCVKQVCVMQVDFA